MEVGFHCFASQGAAYINKVQLRNLPLPFLASAVTFRTRRLGPTMQACAESPIGPWGSAGEPFPSIAAAQTCLGLKEGLKEPRSCALVVLSGVQVYTL